MGYWLEDVNEKWLGDFATNLGIIQLRDKGGPALIEFLDAGEADEELAARVIAETKDVPELAYIAEMLQGAEFPVFITDGETYESEGEEEEE